MSLQKVVKAIQSSFSEEDWHTIKKSHKVSQRQQSKKTKSNMASNDISNKVKTEEKYAISSCMSSIASKKSIISVEIAGDGHKRALGKKTKTRLQRQFKNDFKDNLGKYDEEGNFQYFKF